MKVTKEGENISYPRIVEHTTTTKSLFIIGNLTGNGYPYISLNTGDSGFFTNLTNLVEYNRKVVLEND